MAAACFLFDCKVKMVFIGLFALHQRLPVSGELSREQRD